MIAQRHPIIKGKYFIVYDGVRHPPKKMSLEFKCEKFQIAEMVLKRFHLFTIIGAFPKSLEAFSLSQSYRITQLDFIGTQVTRIILMRTNIKTLIHLSYPLTTFRAIDCPYLNEFPKFDKLHDLIIDLAPTETSTLYKTFPKEIEFEKNAVVLIKCTYLFYDGEMVKTLKRIMESLQDVHAIETISNMVFNMEKLGRAEYKYRRKKAAFVHEALFKSKWLTNLPTDLVCLVEYFVGGKNSRVSCWEIKDSHDILINNDQKTGTMFP